MSLKVTLRNIDRNSQMIKRVFQKEHWHHYSFVGLLSPTRTAQIRMDRKHHAANGWSQLLALEYMRQRCVRKLSKAFGYVSRGRWISSQDKQYIIRCEVQLDSDEDCRVIAESASYHQDRQLWLPVGSNPTWEFVKLCTLAWAMFRKTRWNLKWTFRGSLAEHLLWNNVI